MNEQCRRANATEHQQLGSSKQATVGLLYKENSMLTDGLSNQSDMINAYGEHDTKPAECFVCILHGNTTQNELILWTQFKITHTACICARAGPQVLAWCCTHAAEEHSISKSGICVTLVADLHTTGVGYKLACNHKAL